MADLGDAAHAVAGSEELTALQAHALADAQRDGVAHQKLKVCARLVNADVARMFAVVLVHRLAELYLCGANITLRHTNVPEDVVVAHLGRKNGIGELRLAVIKPFCNQFKLLSNGVIIAFKLPACQLTPILKRDALRLSWYLERVRVEVEPCIREEEHPHLLAIDLALFRAHGRHRADAARIDVGKGIALVVVDDAIRVHFGRFYILRAVGQLQALRTIFSGHNVSV